MNNYQADCLSCQSLLGTKRIPPGNPIFTSKHWTLEHKSQSPIYGWVILVLNTHKSSLADISEEEWREYSTLMPIIFRILKNTFDCEQLYVCQFAAKQGFEHIHWHIIPTNHDLPEKYRGSKIFTILNEPLWRIADRDIIELSEKLQKKFAAEMENFIF
jgi:diadenosine tetraphosphate (Ap4A) HIT family hydrolase